MRADDFTNTPEDAADYHRLMAQDAGPDEPYGFAETRVPFCKVCQRGTKDYTCGPCERERWRAHADEH
jgi:hypothetical protein